MDWNGGCDVGTVNLAWTFADATTRIAKELLLINMTIMGSQKIKLTPANIGRVVHRWVKKYAEHFNKTKIFEIELQPQKKGRFEMHLVQAHLESCIRCMYPHIDVRITDPKDARRWLGTSGGKYKARKIKSVKSGIVSKPDIKRMMNLFRKDKYNKKTKKWTTEAKVDDVVESCMYALHACEHETQAPAPFEVVFNDVNDPGVIHMQNVQLYAPQPREAEEEAPPTKKRKRSESAEPKKRTKAQ